ESAAHVSVPIVVGKPQAQETMQDEQVQAGLQRVEVLAHRLVDCRWGVVPEGFAELVALPVGDIPAPLVLEYEIDETAQETVPVRWHGEDIDRIFGGDRFVRRAVVDLPAREVELELAGTGLGPQCRKVHEPAVGCPQGTIEYLVEPGSH